ncbi:MAG: hypothetical protein HKN09_13700 [Saprospiraceae bacterium]|nr:hypothetical protein [Saprospiraceae bacterium]
MLFKIKDLQAIKKGKIDLAFRNWKSARVKVDSVINTAIGQIKINSIEKSRIAHISPEDIKRSGNENLSSLLKILKVNAEDEVFRIALSYHGEDPRIKLRNQESISSVQFEEVKFKLDRMDGRSSTGPWTMQVLKLIQNHPHQRAQFLADTLERDKDKLKINIRKLKNMGLTQRHEVGYTISPLGKAYLNEIENLKT